MLQTYEQNARVKLTATIVAVIVVAGIVVFADYLKTKGAATTPMSKTVSMAPATTAIPDGAGSTKPAAPATGSTGSPNVSSGASGYKDGRYNASSNYFVPPGEESIAVSLTLQNGVVTGVSIKNSERDRDSATFQEGFAALYKSHVVGKKISGLQIGSIAGASDTAEAFNDALNRIASQAQA